MKQEEYENKKRECWEEYKRLNLDGEVQWQPVSRYDVFCAAFDRAYQLGKQEKDADEQEVLTCEKSKVLYRFRMAEACKIGNNPESDYWIGYSKAIQDLFGFEGEPYVTPNDADTIIQGWIARDFDGILCLYKNKPIRDNVASMWIAKAVKSLDSDLFPDLTWDDEPQEVEIIIKRKKK